MRYLVLSAVAASVAWAPMAMAQSSNAQQQAPAETQNFTEEQIKSYAVSALEVQRINQTYQPVMQAAKTPEEQKAVQDEAVQKMAEAVRSEGLSVQEYNQISTTLRSDPELSRRVQTYMEQEQR